MADYYPLISKAIEGLADKSPTVRRAVYERARQALLTQLQSLDPPVTSADIERERSALDLAIGAVEAKYILPAAILPEAETDYPSEPSQVLLEPIESKPVPHSSVMEETIKEDWKALNPESFDALTHSSSLNTERPKIGSKNHFSGQEHRVRAIVLISSILAVIIAIASWKLYNHEKPSAAPPAPEQADAADNTASETGKFPDRLGVNIVEIPTTDRTSGKSATAVAVQKSLFFEATPETARLPVSQQVVVAHTGRVQWRLEQVDRGNGRPLDNVVVADVDFPSNGFKISIRIRKDSESSSFSHIVEVVFSQAAGDTAHHVIGMDILKAKDYTEEASGPSLSGTVVQVEKNAFMIGLFSTPANVERNVQLLRDKNWFDLLIRFPGGRTGLISIEKGPTGSQIITNAMLSW